MGKTIRDEDLYTTLHFQGDEARADMNKLDRSVRDLSKNLDYLNEKEKRLRTSGKKNTQAYRDLTKEIDKNKRALDKANTELDDYRSNLDINKLGVRELRAEMTRLRRLATDPLNKEWQKHSLQLQKVKARYGELQARAQATQVTLKGMTTTLHRFFGTVAGAIATFASIAFGVKRATDEFVTFDDKITDVQKTTGLARAEVLELNVALKDTEEIDTRTSQEGLLGLLRIAGKLGIEGKENLLGFTKASDQIAVALTEDLGGDIEQSINTVGRLVEIFNVSDEFGIEDGLLKVGSVINELGANSVANEGKIVDFTDRVTGIASATKISIANIMGIGAAADIAGQSMETSGTAITQAMTKMMTDTAEFADLAGMSIDDFTNLVNTDANAAFLKLLEGIKGNDSAATELIRRLDGMGFEGTRVTNVLSSLAVNIDIVKEQQALANEAFEAGTSITEEFNIKNTNAAAGLEKAKKAVNNLWVVLGDRLYPVILEGTNLFGTLLKIIITTIDFVNKYKVVIGTVTAALVGYNTVLALAWLNTKRVSLQTRLLGAEFATYSARVRIATIATRAWNWALRLNPVGLIIGAVVALGAAIYIFRNRTSESTAALRAEADSQSRLNKVRETAIEQISEEKVKTEFLLRIARDKNRSDDERILAINKLKKLAPDQLKFLNLETINTEKATEAVDSYVESLIKKAEAQLLVQEIASINTEIEKLKSLEEQGENNLGLWEKTKAFFGAKWTPKFLESFKESQADIFTENLSVLEQSAEKLKSKLSGLTEGLLGTSTPNPTDPVTGDTTPADIQEARNRYLRESKSQLQQEKLAHQERLKETGLFGKQRSDMTAQELQVLATLEKIHQQNILEIQKKGQQNQIESIREEIVKRNQTALESENARYQEQLKGAGLFGKAREKMTRDDLHILYLLEKEHEANLGKIDADAIANEVGRYEESFKRQLNNLKTHHNQELQQFRGTKEEREALIKDQIRKEEDLVKYNLMRLQTLIELTLDKGSWEGVTADDVLSDEEYNSLKAKLEEIGLSLSELGMSKGTPDTPDIKKLDVGGNTDILGFSADDWDGFFSNLDQTDAGLQKFTMAIGAISNAWKMHNDYVSQAEQRQLEQFQQNTEAKRKALESQMNRELARAKKSANEQEAIREKYNKRIGKLDADLDKKKAQFDHNEARRSKETALMDAIVNTAAAVTSVIANPIFAAIVGALGAIQIGKIATTPLPSIPGRQDGGYLVSRAQDRKMFRARYNPEQRGYVDRPTVLVGESGREMVSSNAAYQNPTVRPVLDMIDTAQRNGTISTINLERIMTDRDQIRGTLYGRQNGGYISAPSSTMERTQSDPQVKRLIAENTRVNRALYHQLRKGVKVALLGEDGFTETNEKLDQINDNVNL